MGASSSTPTLTKGQERIAEEARSAPLVLYTKGRCGYCVQAKKELDEHSIAFEEKNLDTIYARDPANGEAYVTDLISLTKQRTVPQIFICGKFIGGYTELHGMMPNLKKMLEECPIKAKM